MPSNRTPIDRKYLHDLIRSSDYCQDSCCVVARRRAMSVPGLRSIIPKGIANSSAAFGEPELTGISHLDARGRHRGRSLRHLLMSGIVAAHADFKPLLACVVNRTHGKIALLRPAPIEPIREGVRHAEE